jgi:hypothetical protein
MSNKVDSETDDTQLRSVVDALDESVEQLDARTLSNLNRARHQALASAEQPRLFKPSWLPAGSVAALFVAVMAGLLLFSTPDKTNMSPDEFELIVANEDFELMQDLDFVVWMIEQDNAS